MADRMNNSEAAYLHLSAAWLVAAFAALALLLGTNVHRDNAVNFQNLALRVDKVSWRGTGPMCYKNRTFPLSTSTSFGIRAC